MSGRARVQTQADWLQDRVLNHLTSWMYGWMNERMNGWMDEQNKWVSGLMDGQIGGHAHAWMKGRKERRKEGRICR